jgi:hypothetical protein
MPMVQYMKRHAIFNQVFASSVLIAFVIAFSFGVSVAHAIPTGADAHCASFGSGNDKAAYPQCCDGDDNDGDGKADYYGTDKNNDGILDMEPDPICASPNTSYAADGTSEVQDNVAEGSLVPCTDKCTLVDIFKLINNIISFFFRVLLIPIFIALIMYAGYRYLISQGKPGEHARFLRLARHLVIGILIMLFAWLIVHIVMDMLLSDEYVKSGVQFLQ